MLKLQFSVVFSAQSFSIDVAARSLHTHGAKFCVRRAKKALSVQQSAATSTNDEMKVPRYQTE